MGKKEKIKIEQVKTFIAKKTIDNKTYYAHSKTKKHKYSYIKKKNKY